MDIKERLAKSEAKLRELIERSNSLDSEKQEVLQEALRMDGECRVLRELMEAVDVAG